MITTRAPDGANNHIEVKQEEEQLPLGTVFLLLSEAMQIVEYQYFHSDQNIFPFYGFKSSSWQKKTFILAKLVKGLPFCLLGQVLMVSCSVKCKEMRQSHTLQSSAVSREKTGDYFF